MNSWITNHLLRIINSLQHNRPKNAVQYAALIKTILQSCILCDKTEWSCFIKSIAMSNLSLCGPDLSWSFLIPCRTYSRYWLSKLLKNTMMTWGDMQIAEKYALMDVQGSSFLTKWAMKRSRIISFVGIGVLLDWLQKVMQ